MPRSSQTVRRQGCTGRTRETAPDTSSQVRVTLSEDLLSHLRRPQEKHVPLRWLVAGLVCDTFESGTNSQGSPGCAYRKLTFGSGEWRLKRNKR